MTTPTRNSKIKQVEHNLQIYPHSVPALFAQTNLRASSEDRFNEDPVFTGKV